MEANWKRHRVATLMTWTRFFGRTKGQYDRLKTITNSSLKRRSFCLMRTAVGWTEHAMYHTDKILPLEYNSRAHLEPIVSSIIVVGIMSDNKMQDNVSRALECIQRLYLDSKINGSFHLDCYNYKCYLVIPLTYTYDGVRVRV